MYYEGKYRKKREKRQQRARSRRIFFLALILVVIFIALGMKILELEKELLAVNASLAKIQYTLKEYEESAEEAPAVETPATMTPLPTQTPAAEVQETELPVVTQSPQEASTSRKVYLTFDDGPSVYTAEILDILDEYDVKATFFVLGKDDSASIELIQDIYERGHTVGMHSYSHKYNEIYASKEAFIEDYQKIYTFLRDKVGVESFCYRFPGGSSNTISSIDMMEFADYLEEQRVTYYDWNISSGDGSSTALTVEQLKENVLKDMAGYRTAVVLLHDSGDKRSTVDALPEIIEAILAMEDTEILPIVEDTVPVQHVQRLNE
ncbi:MAG: polysaccharide deacetylase [Lachnospiraceae bacterium]|nr:polysaccharide deacetylase [Lachnospiraceae bacterium]